MKQKRKRFSDEEQNFLIRHRFRHTIKELAIITGRRETTLRGFFHWRNLDYLKKSQVHSSTFTSTERKIAKLIALGLTDEEIKKKCFISITTIKTHLNTMYLKIGCHKNTQRSTMRLKVALHYIRNYATDEFIQELRDKNNDNI